MSSRATPVPSRFRQTVHFLKFTDPLRALQSAMPTLRPLFPVILRHPVPIAFGIVNLRKPAQIRIRPGGALPGRAELNQTCADDIFNDSVRLPFGFFLLYSSYFYGSFDIFILANLHQIL